MTIRLTSRIDRSVNFITDADVGYFESRYVSRPGNPYFIVYLSSQSGCAKACRMCHLTSTRQARSVDASVDDFTAQAESVLQHWDNLAPELRGEHQWVHFNFMARGEPLDSHTMLTGSSKVFGALGELASRRGITAKFLVSTIIPKKLGDISLREVFPGILPEVYYSFYSGLEVFRRKWLPQAMDPHLALSKLSDWQTATGKRPKIHFAYIKGENDSEVDVRSMCAQIEGHGLDVDINIVRYNPPDDSSQETPLEEIEHNVDLMRKLLPGAVVNVIPRVGLDVMASCGTFWRG